VISLQRMNVALIRPLYEIAHPLFASDFQQLLVH